MSLPVWPRVVHYITVDVIVLLKAQGLMFLTTLHNFLHISGEFFPKVSPTVSISAKTSTVANYNEPSL